MTVAIVAEENGIVFTAITKEKMALVVLVQTGTEKVYSHSNFPKEVTNNEDLDPNAFAADQVVATMVAATIA